MRWVELIIARFYNYIGACDVTMPSREVRMKTLNGGKKFAVRKIKLYRGALSCIYIY